MFIIIQIPFVDLRLLKKQQDEAAFFPNQFADSAGKLLYYRHFGSKQYRYNSEQLHESEHCFFNSSKLLKFTEIPDANCKLVFSRFFTDDFFFHFDIGLRIKAKDRDDHIDLFSMIQYLFTKNAFVAAKGNMKGNSFNLLSLQRYIELSYTYATTYTKFMTSKKNTHLHFGKTAIFCQSRIDECFTERIKMLCFRFYENIEINKATLYYKNNSNPVHLWFFEKNKVDGKTKDLLRRLRICLLKLNNYREGLEGVFKYLARNDVPVKDLSKLLHAKLEQLLELLNRDEYYGVDGKFLMNYVIERENEVFYESWEESKHKIKFYLERISETKHNPMINVGGDLYMRDQYNAQQVGVQGAKAGTNATIIQNFNHSAETIDYEEIINEIKILKTRLREEEESDEKDVLIGELAHLNIALDKKDDNKIYEILKSSGAQLLDVAKRIGCPLISAYISMKCGL